MVVNCAVITLLVNCVCVYKEGEKYTHIGNKLENADKIVQGWNPVAWSMRRCGRGLYLYRSYAFTHRCYLYCFFSAAEVVLACGETKEETRCLGKG